MFDSSSLTRSPPLHLAAVCSMASPCLTSTAQSLAACSGAVSLYVNIVANLSLHSTATRQSLCWYTERSVALGCTTTPRLTPENWALFIFTADAATPPILSGLFPLPAVTLCAGSPLTSPAGAPTKTKQQSLGPFFYHFAFNLATLYEFWSRFAVIGHCESHSKK